jgi:hypothetical protein
MPPLRGHVVAAGTQEGRMNASPAQRHMALVSSTGCILCARGFEGGGGKVEVHHVAEGSGQRSDFATVCLCYGHHQGQAGLHGLGVKSFCRIYRPPGECEWGLLAWQNEAIAKLKAGALVL